MIGADPGFRPLQHRMLFIALGQVWAAWVEADEGRFPWPDSKPQCQPQETWSKEASTKASLRLPGTEKEIPVGNSSEQLWSFPWNALNKCWSIFTDNDRHVGRLASPLLPMCILCAWAFLPLSLKSAPFLFHLDRKLRRSGKAMGTKMPMKGSGSTAWTGVQ